MAKSTQLKYAIWLYLFLNWFAVAYATETGLPPGIESIPLSGIGRVLWLAMTGGAGCTLVKLTKGPVLRLPVEIIKDLVCSIIAGLLVYFFSNWYKNVDLYLQAGLILLAGYGGSRMIDVSLEDGLIPGMKALFQRVFGIVPKDGGDTP